MNTSLGYSKKTLDDTHVLLSGGGNKPLSDFIGSISWDSTNKKIKYTPVGGSATDLVTLYALPTSDTSTANQVWMRNSSNNGYAWRTLGSRAFDNTSYLPLSGGNLTGSIHLNYMYPLLQFNIIEGWGGSIGYENHSNDSLTFSLTNLASTFNFKSGHIFSSTENYLDSTVTPDFRIGNSTGNASDAYAKIGGNIVWHTGNDGSGSGLDADTVDGYHASDLVRFYLSPMAIGAPADSAKSWFTGTMPSASGAIVYNVPGSEKTIIAGKSSGSYGHMLQLNYDDTYLRILRYAGGGWKSTDWEKISAGYADSAGNADTVDGLHVHGGRNNEANKIVRTDGYGYIQCGYINSSNGDENNNSSPARVWGTSGYDSYMRTYRTSALSVGSATQLQTSRSLWGQSFDGTGDVNGIMTFSTLAMATGYTDVWTDDNGNTHPWYGYDHRYANTGVFSTTISDHFGLTLKTAYGYICMDRDGSVDIGTTSPSQERTLTLLDGSGNTNIPGDVDILGDLDVYANQIWINGSSPRLVFHYLDHAWANISMSSGEIYFNSANDSSQRCNIYTGTIYMGRTLEIYSSGNLTYFKQKGVTMPGDMFFEGSVEYNFDASIYAHGFSNTSDIRKKNIIDNVNINIYNIANAPLFKFTWKKENRYSGQHVGSSAQYWQTVLPELVSIRNDVDQTLSMQYDVIALASAIAVAKKVVDHEERINILENENKMLKEKIIALEQTYKEIEQLD